MVPKNFSWLVKTEKSSRKWLKKRNQARFPTFLKFQHNGPNNFFLIHENKLIPVKVSHESQVE